MRTSGVLLRALTGAAAGLALGGSARGRLGPVTVSARCGLAPAGGTVADLGLLGTATLATHRGPLQLHVRASALDVDDAMRLLQPAALAETRNALPAAGHALLRRALVRSSVSAVAGAATLTAIATRRGRGAAVAGAAVAGALAGAAAAAAATRDTDAWRTAVLDGLVAQAPLLLGDLNLAPAQLDKYRRQLLDLLTTAAEVRRRVAALPEPPADDAVRLVHVSDIHLSPLALPLARLLAEQYDAAAVVDTGDLVDWGTPAEQRLADDIGKLGVPYVYVKGNHDSAGIAAAVARQPNATVLDGELADIAGITFAGMADPRFTADKTTGDDHGMPKVAAAAKRFADFVAGQDVDVALVHSPAAAKPLAGKVPLVLAGDIHRREIRHLDGTTVLVQGSSGGAGLRGVQQDPPVPLTLSVLHLDRVTHRLQAVDDVTLGGIGATDVTLVRRGAAELAGSR